MAWRHAGRMWPRLPHLPHLTWAGMVHVDVVWPSWPHLKQIILPDRPLSFVSGRPSWRRKLFGRWVLCCCRPLFGWVVAMAAGFFISPSCFLAWSKESITRSNVGIGDLEELLPELVVLDACYVDDAEEICCLHVLNGGVICHVAEFLSPRDAVLAILLLVRDELHASEEEWDLLFEETVDDVIAAGNLGLVWEPVSYTHLTLPTKA